MEKFKKCIEVLVLFGHDFIKNLRLALRGTARLFKAKLNVVLITLFMLIFIVYSFMISLNDSYVNYRANVKQYNSKQNSYVLELYKTNKDELNEILTVVKEEMKPLEIKGVYENKKKVIFEYKSTEDLSGKDIILPAFFKGKYSVGDSFKFRKINCNQKLKVKSFTKENKYILPLETIASIADLSEIRLNILLEQPMERGHFYSLKDRMTNFTRMKRLSTLEPESRLEEYKRQIDNDLWSGMQWVIALVIVNLCIVSYLLLRIYDKRYVSYKLCGAADGDILTINSCQTLLLTTMGFILGIILFYSSSGIFSAIGIKQYFTIEKLLHFSQVKPIVKIFLYYTVMLLGTNVIFTWNFLRRNKSLRGGK